MSHSCWNRHVFSPNSLSEA